MSEEMITTPTIADVYEDPKLPEEESGERRSSGKRRKKIIQNLKCPLCESGVKSITYKDVYQLKKFTSVRGKFISTEKSGVCHKHQKQLKSAIKRARFMALLPFSSNE